MSSAMLGALSRCTRSLRGLTRAEEGSFLVEALISALILVIVGLGVLKSLDRGSRLGGEQRIQAVAGNVAHAEQERIRAMSVSEQSNMRRTSVRTVGAVTYEVDSRADWVNDTSGDANCTTPGASADYMKLSTVVTWPQMGERKPVTLESLISPGVRAFDADQGSLAVHVSDRNGDPVSGLQLNLSGGATLSDATNDGGCVMWGYLPAGAGHRLGFSRPPDHVLTDGSQVADVPVAVIGNTTSNVALQYDQGGRISTRFVTKRSPRGTLFASNPQVAHVTNSGSGLSDEFAITSSGGTSGLLFPFTSAYTIHADSCADAHVPVPAPKPFPAPPSPGIPAAPTAVAATVDPGATTTSAAVQLPALNILVTGVDEEPLAGASIRVRTPCGTVYDRTTLADGEIDDPGFPYAGSLSICVFDGTRRVTVARPNNNFNVTTIPISMLDADATGACP